MTSTTEADEPGRRLVCLFHALHAEPSLHGVLLRELSREMPDIHFITADARGLDVVWVCGYERGAASHVERMRRAHPGATQIVTGRGPVESWGAEVLRAGADRVCSWPVDYQELNRFLHHRHSGQHEWLSVLRRGGTWSRRSRM